MRSLAERGEAYGGGLLVGLAILTLWGGMIDALATGVASAAAIAVPYIVLLVLLGLTLPVYRGIIGGLPLESPFSWVVLTALLSITAVVLAPLIGPGLIAAYFRGKG
ncbi:hypothetical protein [Rhodophyticola porphyridii]|uniref:Uncharacterized protein n=1 Tax=Rhodophyticola porphyridii TaxID=1852017 RepID=A0A3L9Y4X2_9RHOB|nr:hypothetical protein [Rhodophyticola porphyridii]RMA42485.1 hypothetical protein D9R08_10375 [Rhodophyticola porphyridii]